MKTASPLEFALIGLLRHRAQSGYDLRKTFIDTAMRHYSDSPGPFIRHCAGWPSEA
jgi:DNA-binding PadR family transcriptional regulator